MNEVTFEQIENELLIAPLRIFKEEEMRGFFESELKERFGITQERIQIMLTMRSTFKWKMKTIESRSEVFFYLKGWE